MFQALNRLAAVLEGAEDNPWTLPTPYTRGDYQDAPRPWQSLVVSPAIHGSESGNSFLQFEINSADPHCSSAKTRCHCRCPIMVPNGSRSMNVTLESTMHDGYRKFIYRDAFLDAYFCVRFSRAVEPVTGHTAAHPSSMSSQRGPTPSSGHRLNCTNYLRGRSR